MGVNSLPKTVTRQRRSCDLNPGPSAPESSRLTSRLPSHPRKTIISRLVYQIYSIIFLPPIIYAFSLKIHITFFEFT